MKIDTIPSWNPPPTIIEWHPRYHPPGWTLPLDPSYRFPGGDGPDFEWCAYCGSLRCGCNKLGFARSRKPADAV